jgi:hypothetical protein
MARNRVIYQSEAIFVSPNATGAHFTASAVLTGIGSAGGGFETALYPISPVGLRADPIESKSFIGAVSKCATSLVESDLASVSGAFADAAGVNPADIMHPANHDTATDAGISVFTDVDAWDAFAANAKGAGAAATLTGVLIQPVSGTYDNLVQQIHRVQSANYSFSINRTDVNTFGQLARIDAIALEPPTVSLDFSYYPTDGFNERNLGFYVQGQDAGGANPNVGYGMGDKQLNAISGHLQDDSAGRNFFILTTPEGTDAFNTTRAVSTRSVISLGNGYLSDYSLDAAVGSIPNVSCTVELFNAKSDMGTTGVEIPAVTLDDGKPVEGTQFTLGHPESLRGDDEGASPSTGDVTATALRPGDITMDIPESLSIFSDVSGDGSVHIQNMSLSIPLARSPIDRLGTRFAFSRVVDFPIVATLSVSALVSEIGTGNLANIIDSCDEEDIKITMKSNASCGVGDAKDALIIDFKGARIDSESMSSDIGSNKSVDLSFTTQIGGPEDKEHGVFISGANRTVVPAWAPAPCS